jgi:hypothetical protein
MDKTRCIWCVKPTTRAEPREHILGEGLVGDRPFHLETLDGGATGPDLELCLKHGEVCGRCNHKNGRLDECLIDQFGLLRVYWNPVGTKRGRPATAARPGMYAERRDDGPHITLNGEGYTIRNPHGISVGPAQSKEDAVRIDAWSVANGIGNVRFSQPIRYNKRLSRALHKIAFELLCFQAGAKYVLDKRYDPIREYVLHGRGTRRFAIWPNANGDDWATPKVRVEKHPAWPHWVAVLNLGATYYVDLSPRCELLMEKLNVVEATKHGLVAIEDGIGALNPPQVAA